MGVNFAISPVPPSSQRSYGLRAPRERSPSLGRIRSATLVVISARPGFFDLNAVRETVATARERNKPYAVVLNATPLQRFQESD
jgi:hypothetical protein